ncbi:MAG TPA: aldehyde dehydrogenase family protein [Myxococcota bacterium]|nr:aldehyde dehydrogenase family protein [Myxococcota bacterium]
MNAQPPRTIIECYEPATRRPLGAVPVDDPDEVRATIARARAAQAAWGERPVRDRLRVLERILAHVLDHADELCQVITRDAGKTREHAMLGEIWPVCEKLRWTLANAERYLAPEPVSSGLLVHKRARIEYRPLGVVGVICPWNYPLQNVLGPTITALAAGNAAVVKVSEWVAWSGARIQAIFDEALLAEGVSPDLVHLVHGYGETGAALVSGGVDVVVFTGSVGNGRRVIAESSKTVTPVVAELGGKDAMIVCDDADLDQALHALLAGVFINAGQNCLSSERILVHEAIYDRFEAMVVEAVRALRVGPPEGEVDVGAIISPLQVDVIERLVQGSVAAGARALVGGARVLEDTGQFFAPTVLAEVTPEMPIFREETFGPVVALVRFRDDAHAIAMANGTEFGLSSTVFSRDAARARRIGDRMIAGSTLINDFGLTYMVQELPFGGAKASGFGRLNGRAGLHAMCNVKSVVEDRVPLHQPNRLFPVRAGDYETYAATIQAVYRTGLGERARSVRSLIGAWWRNGKTA